MKIDWMNKKVNIAITGIFYGFGVWSTFGFLSWQTNACRAIESACSPRCGDVVINTVASMMWPIYWFFKSSMIFLT